MKIRAFIAAFLVCLSAACGESTERQVSAETSLPEPIRKTTAMVVTANPHASKAGADVLRAGGSAVDAAIAIEAVLSLVEPQSSGLGGGGYMTHFDKQTKTVSVYDGRETAPQGATADMFLDQAGQPLGYIDAKNSGLSTGVPGMVSMLQLAHQDHGKLAWGQHFAAARSLALNGFAVSERLHGLVTRFQKYIPSTEAQGPTDAYRYLLDEQGNALPVGHLLKNPDYVQTLDTIASDPSAFYQGQIADDIVAQISKPPHAGSMRKQDLATYTAQRREALCTTYRQTSLCGPPPSSSWLAVAMIMGLLEHAPAFSDQGADDVRNWALFGEAQRLAYADRDHFVADVAKVAVPVSGLLDADYLRQRATLISMDQAIEAVAPGNPWLFDAQQQKVAGVDATNDVAGTTHFVVVDADGDVVSLTASVESIFGSTRMAGGMFLNNQLTDFSFESVDKQGNKIANAVEPGKRPRSSMSPTIVLDQQGEFLLATGSPGGNSIIAYTAKTLVGILDWGLSPQQAIDLPNMVARGDRIRIEKSRASEQLINSLRDFGYEVKESAGENSGFSVVMKDPQGNLVSGVDPRREGTVEIIAGD